MAQRLYGSRFSTYGFRAPSDGLWTGKEGFPVSAAGSSTDGSEKSDNPLGSMYARIVYAGFGYQKLYYRSGVGI